MFLLSGIIGIESFSQANSTCLPAPVGLVGWWKGEGTTADSAGGNSGVNQHVSYTSGVAGQAFAFDPENFPYGTYSGIQVADRPAYALTNALTIEGWIRPRGDSYIIFSRADHRPGLDPYHLSMQANNTIHFGLSDAVGNSAIVETVISYFAWTHVAATLDGSAGTMSIYTNGVLAAQTTTSVRPFAELQADQSPGIGIGNLNDGGNNFPFIGDIDEIGLYNRALSAPEIQFIYQAGNAGKCMPSPTTPSVLLNIDFGAGQGPSAKTGPAATGQNTSDFWNYYSRDDASGHWKTSGALTNLKLADGAVTSVGLTVDNAPGAWGNGSTDPMFVDYIYPFEGNATFTITNLPPGNWDVYAYSTDGNYEVVSGGVSYGIKYAQSPEATNPPVWIEGISHARFLNVAVAVGQPLVLTVRPGLYGYAIISGMQIVSRAATNIVLTTNCAPVPSGLVAWWPAEANSSDVVGKNKGMLSGGASYSPGEVGQAFSFTDSNPAVLATASSNLNVGSGDGLTLEAWISPTDITQDHPLFEWNNSTYWGVHFHIAPGQPTSGSSGPAGPGQLYANVVDSFGGWHQLGSAAGVIAHNVFQHVALTYDKASGLATIYRNGQIVSQLSLGSFTPLTTYDLYLGRRQAPSSEAVSFAGLMDEPAVYNRALSQAEIQAVYNAGTAGKCQLSPPPRPFLLDVDCGAGFAGSAKTGPAAVGQTASDFWNFFTREDGIGSWRTFGALTGLKLADGTVSTVGLTIANAPGAWPNGSSDAMLNDYIYPFDGGNVTVTITNLPAGQYDVLPYSLNGSYEVASGGVSYGLKSCYGFPVANPPVWTEGVQFVRFTNVQISAGQPLVITAKPTATDGALLSGFQIVSATITNVVLATNCTPAPSGLVAWWPADGNAGDFAGSNNGTLQGGAAYAAGENGQSFIFNGADSYVEVPDVPALRLTNELTIEFWVKRQHPFGPDYIVNRGGDWTGGVLNYGVAIAPPEYGNILHFTFAGGNRGTVAIDDLSWHHCAVVARNGDNDVTFYVDGSYHPTTHFEGEGLVNLYPSTKPLHIGAQVDSDTGWFYYSNTSIDELGIYNRALTALEIQAIYRAGCKGKCPLPPNQPPVANAAATVPVVISLNTSNAIVVLDGSLSSDPDGDPLQYQWFENNAVSATASGIVSVVILPAGTNLITLSVTDGRAANQQTIPIEVITTAQAVERLIGLVNTDVSKAKSLAATLSAAIKSIDRNNPTAAINQLQAFQNQVRAQITPLDSALADTLINEAQVILDILADGDASVADKFAITIHQTPGHLHLKFSTSHRQIFIVETSTNMID